MSERLSLAALLLAAALGPTCCLAGTMVPSATPEPTAAAVPTPAVRPTSAPLPTAGPASEPQAGLHSESLGDGWARYTNAAREYSLELPETWMVLDATLTDIEEALAQVAELNPDLERMIELALGTGMVELTLIGTDTDPASLEGNPSGVSANVVSEDLLAGFSPALLLRLVVSQMDVVEGYTIIESGVVGIGELEAARLVVELSMTDPLGREIHNRNVQVIVPTEETAFVVTAGTAAARFADYESTFERIVNSFRLVEE
jgi:hypothetical protein